ncbi:MAG: SDR family NAD(P)-dependent oxidoreductase [Phycisphaerae bacterium]|nr:SDR family NAD(P)-dependent oxidoreductase [Phycisphaerae bacterium]
MRFDGVHAVVTGGAGALGHAVVARLLAAGSHVHVPWFDETDSAAPSFTGGAYTTSKVDLRSESEVNSFYRSLPDLGVSIHLAGGFAMAPILETTGADVERMMQMNAMTCFYCCREAVRRMRSAGRGGRIVNVAARPAVRPVGGMIAYSMSKAAVASITQSLAEEVREDRILVNAILPSILNTPANRAAMPDADHASWPLLDDVTQMIVSLAAPANTVTSGALLPVYGRA